MRPLAKLAGAAMGLVTLVMLFTIVPSWAAIHSQLWGLNQLHFAEFRRKLEARTAPTLGEPFYQTASVAEAPVPAANRGGGLYQGPLSVALHADDGIITYTLDGSIPTRKSTRYRDPVPISRTTALRFRSFREGFLPSPVVTHTYVVDLNINLPVVSVVTDPVNLWNKYSGIYDNPEEKGSEWQRAADVESFAAPDAPAMRFPAEIRVHGQTSRSRPKKSFRLIYESRSVEPRRGESIWHARPGESTRTMVLRTGGTYRLRNELFQAVYGEAGGIGSPVALCLLLLNGEVWGLYNVQEHIDQGFLTRHVGPGSYDLIPDNGNGPPVAGDKKAWRALEAFYQTTDLSDENAFREITKLIDLDNLTDHWLFNVYGANFDWPHRNILAFRERTGAEDRRWRWISWDVDATFDLERQGLHHDTVAWAFRDGLRHDLRFNHQKGLQDREEMVAATLLVRKLTENEHYRQRLITRLCNLLNTTLSTEHVEGIFNGLLLDTASGLPLDWKRWSIEPAEYWAEVGSIRRFVRERPDLLRRYVQQFFGLGNPTSLTLVTTPDGGGDVAINGALPGAYPFVGTYFPGLTVDLRATPREGYVFAGWSDPVFPSSAEASVLIDRPRRISARFRRHAP